GYFLRQDMKSPVRIAVTCMVANLVFNLILVWRLAHVCLAVATSLSALRNAGMPWRRLRKGGVYPALPGWPMFTLRLLLACAALSVVVLWLAADVQQWFEWGWQQKVLQMSMLVVAGIAVFLVTLVASGMRMRHVRK